MDDHAVENTDIELWREPVPKGESDGMSYYQPSIHVTKQGGIGINVGGHVYVKTLTEWHRLATSTNRETPVNSIKLREVLGEFMHSIEEWQSEIEGSPTKENFADLDAIYDETISELDKEYFNLPTPTSGDST